MKKNYFLTMLAILFSGIVSAQIVQATHINTTAGASIGAPGLYKGEIFFQATDGSSIGKELYKIAVDGTVSLVKDMNTDSLDTTPDGLPKYFTEYNGLLYFNGDDGDKSTNKHNKELWVTDGTTAGTKMVADIRPGGGASGFSSPANFFVFNGKLYFSAQDIATRNQLWRYDGVNPPVKITAYNSDGYSGFYYPTVDEANGKTYFKVSEGAYELGVLNADETYQLIDVNPGTGLSDHGYTGSSAGLLYKGKYYFSGNNGASGKELFVSDGTTLGTTLVKDIWDGGDSDPKGFTIYNNELYFFAKVATGMQLWKTDGTPEGTTMVAEPYVGGNADMNFLTSYNGKLYFSANDGINGNEVWTYDGTTATLLKDINTTSATGSNPQGFKEVGGFLFFTADDGSGVKLWVTSGTQNGTVSVETLFTNSEMVLVPNYVNFIVNGSKLYFTGNDALGDEMFMIDTKSIVTADQVTNINKTGGSGIANPAAYKGEIFFQASDGSSIGKELYKIALDGMASLVKDMNTDSLDTTPDGLPKYFTEYNGLLYFNGDDGDKSTNKHNKELWVTDGTTAGTKMVADIRPGGGASGFSSPANFFVFNGKLYFSAQDNATRNQFWRYDGVNPPVKITAYNSDGYSGFYYPTVDEANGKTYFKVSEGAYQLGILNADETSEIIDINPGTGLSDHSYTGSSAGLLYNGKYYFSGNNGTSGKELFVSDGTTVGTTLVKDIWDGGDSDPKGFTIYNDGLYFFAKVATGMQLWKTDGTAEGTAMVAEPYVAGNADMNFLTSYNGKLYFSATDGINGKEVWTYDGNSAAMLKDINTVAATGSDPSGFKEVDGLLFFAANDGTGVKLWVSNGDAQHTMSIADAMKNPYSPTNVDYLEFVAVGTVLYYTANDVNGFDNFYKVDAKKLFSQDVTFTVTDMNGPLEGATVEFDGTTSNTDATGKVTFPYVRIGNDLAYKVTKTGFNTNAGTVIVMEEAVNKEVLLVLTTYQVTFNVTDGTLPLAGAIVTFNGTDLTTDATGTVVFTNVAPGTGLVYTVTLNSNYSHVDAITDITGNKVVDVTLIDVTAIDKPLINNASIYPNPSKGSIIVKGMHAGAIYVLYNMNQQKISEGILDGNHIDLNVKAGIYILKIDTKESTFRQRLIVY